MKKKILYIITVTAVMVSITAGVFQLNSCKVSEEIQAKSGAQLWGENCSRCHNIPSPADFNDSQWDAIGMHMRVRTNLTAMEAEKIVEFLKTAN